MLRTAALAAATPNEPMIKAMDSLHYKPNIEELAQHSEESEHEN